MADFCIEYEATLNYLGVDTKDASGLENEKRIFYTAVLNYVHWLCDYEEEDRKIRFDLLVGFNKNFDEFAGRAYCLHKKKVNTEDVDDVKRAVKSALKCSLPMCNDHSNLFLCIDLDGKVLLSGVYYVEMGRGDDGVKEMTKKGYVFFRCYCDNTVIIEKDKDYQSVTFSYCESNPIVDLPTKNNTLVKKCWNDLFYRIKRSVHGTICLIVDPEWKIEDDENFYKKDTNDKRILELPSKTINISPVECLMMENPSEFENNFAMFVSMLNFDGVTVIDTNGFIHAYNGICNLDPSKRYFGGARHQAYQQLVTKANSKYAGVYMQSQEGEVSFHSFADTGIDMSWFDPNVMKWSPDKYQDEIKSVKAMVLSSYKSKELYDMLTAALELRETHKGYNNFHNEPEKAKELLDRIKLHQHDFNKDYINDNLHCFRHTVNALLLCKIGNIYGVSTNAQKYIDEALGCFEDYWKIYAKNKLYYDKDLLKVLATPYNPIVKWIRFFEDKDVGILSKYSSGDYHEMLEGFIQMELEEKK